MDTIILHYDGHTPSVEGVGVSGEVGTCILQCTFDSVWSAYPDRTAVLVSSFGVFAETLDADNRVLVPASVVPRGDEAVRVSVFGTATAANGAILRYNGEPIRIRFHAGGETAKILNEPEMTAYERLLARLRVVEGDLGESITQTEIAAALANFAADNADTAAQAAQSATADTITATTAAAEATEDAIAATQNAITATEDAIAAAAEARGAAAGKADKVTEAAAGDLAGLDSAGNLTDSGIAAAKVVTVAAALGQALTAETWNFTLADSSTLAKLVLTGAAAQTEGK